jgi:signal peptidase
MTNTTTPTPTSLQRLGRLVAGTLVAAAVALAALMLVPALLGYQRYVITGGSMTGTYDRGSLVFDRAVPTAQLREGDVITFRPPPSAGIAHSGLVTHRIAKVTHGHSGAPVFRTKGDANAVADPYAFSLHRQTQARVAFHVPYVGYVFAALGIRWVRMLVIGLPALLVALSVLAGLWRDAGQELRSRGAATEVPSA